MKSQSRFKIFYAKSFYFGRFNETVSGEFSDFRKLNAAQRLNTDEGSSDCRPELLL